MENNYLEVLNKSLRQTGLFRRVTSTLLSRNDFAVSIWYDHVCIIPLLYSSSLSIDSEVITDEDTMDFYFGLFTRSNCFDEIAAKHENYRIGKLIDRM